MSLLYRLIVPDFRWTTAEKLQRAVEATALDIAHMAVLADRYPRRPVKLSDSFVYARDQIDHANRWVQ